jgi:hypothetical protein
VSKTFLLLFLQNIIFLKIPILEFERKEHLPSQMASANQPTNHLTEGVDLREAQVGVPPSV